jgi:hypothetical protein
MLFARKYISGKIPQRIS